MCGVRGDARDADAVEVEAADASDMFEPNELADPERSMVGRDRERGGEVVEPWAGGEAGVIVGGGGMLRPRRDRPRPERLQLLVLVLVLGPEVTTGRDAVVAVGEGEEKDEVGVRQTGDARPMADPLGAGAGADQLVLSRGRVVAVNEELRGGPGRAALTVASESCAFAATF